MSKRHKIRYASDCGHKGNILMHFSRNLNYNSESFWWIIIKSIAYIYTFQKIDKYLSVCQFQHAVENYSSVIVVCYDSLLMSHQFFYETLYGTGTRGVI